MKVKPKEVLLNLPIVLTFEDYHELPQFAANINALISGKSRIKYEELGTLAGKYIGIFYLQRNAEFSELRESFMQMIDAEELARNESHVRQ